MGRVEIFRVGGIPIFLDFFFVLLAVLFSWPYWSGGSNAGMSAGFVLVIGLFDALQTLLGADSAYCRTSFLLSSGRRIASAPNGLLRRPNS